MISLFGASARIFRLIVNEFAALAPRLLALSARRSTAETLRALVLSAQVNPEPEIVLNDGPASIRFCPCVPGEPALQAQ